MSHTVPIVVRGYELDTLGHVNQAVYHQYAEHARWELLREAGLAGDKLIAAGIAPVVLETTIKYLRELRGGDEITVTTDSEWTSGKIFRFRQRIVKLDGTVSAELVVTGGVMDLTARKLIADPAERLRALADRPDLLDL
ncbi:acyl-CoA thioesterase [Nocardia puris]|uniref:Acyl-CoA thioester hydrolase n=1 Tax=Nocardia puris TaxID=208602 RepID=A0A366DWM3_9NOCA|nr:acyl-CoA thioesterase [Nocardia puris]MBF6209786.1 acyl-CoA thioesterase [Nocardia puris]MBF6366358.1 acyl-CoA thioesterase [Nocardia puris]MBF6458303.1 acyl-CoA thioesterase [Nocardia puris]RBO94477.1 acyl-CoA thioester hydrolase [Nocardia puris]